MSRFKRNIGYLLIGSLIAGIIGLHFWSLLRFPAIFVDEPWFASRAWAYTQTGRNFSSLDSGVLDRFDGYWTFYPLIPTILQSLVLRFSPEPALFPVRLVSLISGLILLIAIYYAGYGLGGRWLGFLSAIFTSVSWSFIYSSHLARIDIFAATFGYAALGVYLNNRSLKQWAGWISGLLVGIAMEIHPHSVIFFLAMIALYFHDHSLKIVKNRGFWFFITGFASGLIIYIGIHILQYPNTFFALNKVVFAPTHTPPILTLDPAIILSAFYDMIKLVSTTYLPFFLIIIYSIIVIMSHRHQDTELFVVVATMFLGAALLFRNKSLFYMILITPIMDIFAVAFLIHLTQKIKVFAPRNIFQTGLIGGIYLGMIALNLSVLRIDARQDYRYVQNNIKQAIRNDDSIMATQLYWFGLYEHNYYSWEQLIYYESMYPGSTLEQSFEAFKPDIFIIDEHLRRFISDPDGYPNSNQFILPKSELSDFLEKHASLASTFESSSYGQIQIYRLVWNEN